MSTPQTARDIIHSLPDRFKPETVDADLDKTFHFKLSGDNGGEFTARVHDQTCEVQDGLHGEPDCVVQAKDSVYRDIELGEQNAQMAFMMGKIKISNIGAMLKFIESFERLH